MVSRFLKYEFREQNDSEQLHKRQQERLLKNPGPLSTFNKSKIRERTGGVSRCRTVKSVKSNNTSINEEQTDFAKQNKNQRFR